MFFAFYLTEKKVILVFFWVFYGRLHSISSLPNSSSIVPSFEAFFCYNLKRIVEFFGVGGKSRILLHPLRKALVRALQTDESIHNASYRNFWQNVDPVQRA